MESGYFLYLSKLCCGPGSRTLVQSGDSGVRRGKSTISNSGKMEVFSLGQLSRQKVRETSPKPWVTPYTQILTKKKILDSSREFPASTVGRPELIVFRKLHIFCGFLEGNSPVFRSLKHCVISHDNDSLTENRYPKKRR